MRQLLHGNCLELLPTIPDQSVDMVLCDLPYQKTAACWDEHIPMDTLWREYKRIVKPHGAIVLTAVQPFTSLLVVSNPRWYRHSWVWRKTFATGFLNAKKQPLREHEDIVVFGEYPPQFYPQMETRNPYRRHRTRPNTTVHHGHLQERQDMGALIAIQYPRTLLHVASERGWHPTQKPVALFEYLIRTYTQPGQTVLDHCAGSMTTAIAAIHTGREYLCMERDADYFNKGMERVDRELTRVIATPLMSGDAA